MQKNIGTFDRLFRVVVGFALLSLLFFLEGNARWFGLIGLIPLGTAMISYCPLYTVIGLNTCPLKHKDQ